MIFATDRWERLGRIAYGDGTLPWMLEYAGASCAVPALSQDQNPVEILITGRDQRNRSIIGRGWLTIDGAEIDLVLDVDPVLAPGQRGAFDENGVSYPTAVISPTGEELLFYTGWMPTVMTPFQNHIGLARRAVDGTFERISRAPLLDRTDSDPFSTGSCGSLVEGDRWTLWYTSFTSWGDEHLPPQHSYLIKTAVHQADRGWVRSGDETIGWVHPGEHSTCRPTVLKLDDGYHMWFCWRGVRYQIGYAWSADGRRWTRDDSRAGIVAEPGGWERGEQCYPHAFVWRDHAYLLYSGHGYGLGGLGIARRPLRPS